jgi:hypothetical protein|tara:strand:- start:8885 stop:9085 length:201 start_codon:yes stop_codon:yes gene_type:complete
MLFIDNKYIRDGEINNKQLFATSVEKVHFYAFFYELQDKVIIVEEKRLCKRYCFFLRNTYIFYKNA